MNPNRVRILKGGHNIKGPIVYWMSRDQRVNDNWAIIHARELAEKYNVDLRVLFTLTNNFLGAEARNYGFMLDGLKQVEEKLRTLGIGFTILNGDPSTKLCEFIDYVGASVLVFDFDPLLEKRRWQANVFERLNIPVHEVDAHNVVPCWIASEKQEYAAYTFRPKIMRILPKYLVEPEHIMKSSKKIDTELTDWKAVKKKLIVEDSAIKVDWLKPGEENALKALKSFIAEKLSAYPEARNDPNLEGQSGLSPYLHFGQLSAQRLAYEVIVSNAPQLAKDSFIEELIIRRELSDNFCFYNPYYDSMKGFPDWAKKTLIDHLDDAREYNYKLSELESANTHDLLWNAAQREMVFRGRMHGYLRMYWAKKILEWSTTPEEALSYSIYLNNKYQLDGRDPNGYVGCAWSIGGVHDRPWPERPIYGKIRYMNYSGAMRKFDVNKYISKISSYT